MGTPGQDQLATSGANSGQINRGSQVLDGIVYFVNGTGLKRLNADFTISNLGTIAGSGKVSMPENGIELMILVPGGNGYIWNKDTASLVTITDTDFVANGRPQIAIFIAGYFMCNTDTKKVIISNLNAGTVWDALDFGTAEVNPDPIVTLVNYKNEAHLLGSESGEALENVGGGDFPFLANGLILDKGCFARFSVVKASNTFMFIGGEKRDEPAVWTLQGNELVQLSNTGVDELLNALTDVEMDQVSAYTYSQDKSRFVGWKLPLMDVVYGIDTGKWHLRQSEITDGAGIDQTVGWRSTALVSAYSKLICFDTQDGRVGSISLDDFDEYGTTIQREFDANPIRAGKNTFTIPRIEVTPEAGVGDATTPNPKIRMKLSRDGQTFGGERVRSLGLRGKTQHRPVWRQNGRAKQYLLPRFLVAEKVRPVIIRVDAEIGGGRV